MLYDWESVVFFLHCMFCALVGWSRDQSLIMRLHSVVTRTVRNSIHFHMTGGHILIIYKLLNVKQFKCEYCSFIIELYGSSMTLLFLCCAFLLSIIICICKIVKSLFCYSSCCTTLVWINIDVYVCDSYQMQDWDGKLLAEANAKKHTLPSFFPITYRYPIPRDWDSVSKVCMLSTSIAISHTAVSYGHSLQL